MTGQMYPNNFKSDELQQCNLTADVKAVMWKNQ